LKLFPYRPSSALPSLRDCPTTYPWREVKFELVPAGGEPVLETTGAWDIRNNANVKFEDVLSGDAVFVYDGSDAAGHAGETDYGAGAVADGDKMFDFVQELLNQVVPRKRSVTSYTLVDENGVYGDSTRDAVAMFRSSFSLDVTKWKVILLAHGCHMCYILL